MKVLYCCGIAALACASFLVTRTHAQEGLSQSLCKATDTIGMSVKDPNRHAVGKIEDIVLDRASGRVVYAVVSLGGFLGMGESYYAIPWTAFTTSADQEHLVLAFSKERLKAAPGFPRDNWPDMANQTWARQIDQFYAQTGQSGHGDIDLNIAEVARRPLNLSIRVQKNATFIYVLSAGTTMPTAHTPAPRGSTDNGQRVAENVSDAPPGPRAAGISDGLEECRVTITVDEVKADQIEFTCRTSMGDEPEQTFQVRSSPLGEITGLTSSAGTRWDGSSKGVGEHHLRNCLAYVLGKGLHQRELQPSQFYDIPHDLCGTVGKKAWVMAPATDRSRGSPLDDNDNEVGQGESPPATQKNVSLRFEGTKDVNGHRCAMFSTIGVLVQTDPQGSKNAAAPSVGVVAYRISDGLLEHAFMQPSATDATDRVVLRREGALVH